ncbi:ZGPAT [Bugula neritina]|uniref:Zinc finger CCCH-type with G patch domain-containing protein n=1 Tax=Bugula neritina TaxID=10212 RepID=A0A7J7JPL7_BUGNE|nr:ZGPAT [Bugula neritina]
MDANTLKDTLKTYEDQLRQVNQALEASGNNSDELLELRDNLVEVIALTNDSLQSLSETRTQSQPIRSKDGDEDDEYAAFQAALADDVTHSSDLAAATAADNEEVETVLSSNLDDLIGTCVRAPHSQSWGEYQHCNAAIIGFNADTEQVRVMFCQPTHISMKICPHYMRGQCRFGDEECKLSHGHLVDIDDLQEFIEADCSELSVGDTCLAKFSEDELWYRATVVDTHGEEFLEVMFNDYGEATHAVEKCDVIPTNSQSDSSSSDEESTPGNDGTTTENVDELPNYLWKPSDSEKLADWESHTRGVGSKLMALMGYKPGEGLGKDSQGRVEPVPILKLPPGKSLDRIMELKRRTGNKDMFDVLKKKEKHKLKAASGSRAKSADLFTYLNKSLGHGRKVDMTSYRKQTTPGKSAPSVISKHQLSKKSDKSINIQVMKTEEELSRVEKEIISIKQRLEINVSRRDAGGVKHLTEKLTKAERYLETLTKSYRELHRHKGQREGRKKLSIF